MRLEAAKLLWDVRTAGKAIIDFTGGLTLANYEASDLLCSAVERKFEIIGEALTRLRRTAPEVAAQIGPLDEIVGFRNRLAHGYDTIDDAVVWDIVQQHLMQLLREVGALLDAQPNHET